MDYSDGVPEDYRCSRCGKGDVKLWRQYQTFADHIKLLCLTCAEADQKSFCKYSARAVDIVQKWKEMWDLYAIGNSLSLDTPEKMELSELHSRATSDSIGWLVPAVPTEDGETYWGYTSVPDQGIEWWKRLALR